jgi:hypothetical protein
MGNNLMDLSKHRTSVTHFPMFPDVKLENPYTIFEPEFPVATNILVKRDFGITGWKGDLLIVKHPYDNLSHVTDIEEKDQVLVELIVEKYILEIQKGNQADLIH